MSLEQLTKCSQCFSRPHILWQVVKDLWAGKQKNVAADS